MNRGAGGAARIVSAFRVVVRGVAIEKTVGNDLVNALRLPEAVGNRLSGGVGGKQDQSGESQ